MLVAESPIRSNSANDMVHGHELAQIPGHRLEQGDQAHAFPVNGLLQAIDRDVPGDHLAGQVPVPRQHGPDALLYGGGRQARQLHQVVLHRGQIPGKFGLDQGLFFQFRYHFLSSRTLKPPRAPPTREPLGTRRSQTALYLRR